MQTFMMYVLPSIEAVIIVVLYALLRSERAAGMRDYERRLDEALKQREPRVHMSVRLPTKEEIAAARERGDDWKFHNPVPQPTQIVGRPAMQRKR